jgi:hypothetical protein
MSSVLGASVSVNVTELEKNATHLDNSTKALNGSKIIHNIREAVLVIIMTFKYLCARSFDFSTFLETEYLCRVHEFNFQLDPLERHDESFT